MVISNAFSVRQYIECTAVGGRTRLGPFRSPFKSTLCNGSRLVRRSYRPSCIQHPQECPSTRVTAWQFHAKSSTQIRPRRSSCRWNRTARFPKSFRHVKSETVIFVAQLDAWGRPRRASPTVTGAQQKSRLWQILSMSGWPKPFETIKSRPRRRTNRPRQR